MIIRSTVLPSTIETCRRRNIFLRSRSSATATARAKSTLTTSAALTVVEARLELSRSTTLFATLLATTVAALALATGSTTAAWTTLLLAITAQHAARRRVRALLLDVGLGHDFGGEVEPFTEIVEAFWGEGVVVPLPGELGLEVALGGEGLAGLDDL
jgi:hypothetical protein